MRRPPLPGGVGVLSVCLLATLALLGSASPGGAADVPGGNNGTVKIHAGLAGTTPIVRNEPHVCTFHLHFYFADPAQSGSWQIRAWAPGDKGPIVLSGDYDTAPDGADREPAAGVYGLPNGHYKLFWTGRTEHNVKHKTFWVECPAAPSPPSVASQTPAVGPTPVTSPTGEVSPASASPPASPAAQELPAAGSPAITLPPTDASPAHRSVRVDAGSALALAGLCAALLAFAGWSAMGRLPRRRRR